MAAPISLLTPNWTAHHQGFPKTRQVKPNPLPPRPVEEPARWPCNGGFSCGYPQITPIFKIGSSVVNHPCCGVSIYGNLQMLLLFLCLQYPCIYRAVFMAKHMCPLYTNPQCGGELGWWLKEKHLKMEALCSHYVNEKKKYYSRWYYYIYIYISYSQMQVLSWVRHELCAQKCTGSKTMLSQNWKGPGMILA